MILVDTSIWLDHFRRSNSELQRALLDGEVLTHPFVIGELACGNFKNRQEVLQDLAALPRVEVATDGEVLRFLEDRKLWGLGIGWIDCHVLASALLTKCHLWTLDKRLDRGAESANVALHHP